MSRKRMFTTSTGEQIDLSITEGESASRTLIIYPFIGGTTRLFEIPFQKLTERNISIVEYHPPAHGRSTGQMTMPNALRILSEIRSKMPVDRPVIALGHSAGANAVLRYASQTNELGWLYLVQPVFSFRESAAYMYSHGFYEDLLGAISKWVSNRDKLDAFLCDGRWLDRNYWQATQLREKINAISVNLLLGSFLEDFYIVDYESFDQLREFYNRTTVFIGNNDRWYSPERIASVCERACVAAERIPESQDHFFRGAWGLVWERVLEHLDSRLS